MTVFGTRPEAIKMAPVIKELQINDANISCIVTVTGQHREMLDQVLRVFSIQPDYDLNVMRSLQTLTEITFNILKGLDEIYKKEKPDIVLVHGDTTTTFAGSLAAFYNKIPIGHVEAGLRTKEKYSPFPEEINRQLTGVLSDLHFAPTNQAYINLIEENKNKESIFITGNTAIDALNTTIKSDYKHEILEQIGNRRFLLLTAHRRENQGESMKSIFCAVKKLIEEHSDIELVFPVHLNPTIQKLANSLLSNHPRIHLIEPLDVIDFHNFAARAYLILTDSGGIQEEAPSLGVPVIVLRESTERSEGLVAGNLILAGTNEENIYKLVKDLLINNTKYGEMSKSINPYGDGLASKRIVESILYHFGVNNQKPTDFSIKIE